MMMTSMAGWPLSVAGRSVETVRDDLSYLVEQYGSHPSFLPLYYIYDSYHISSHDWSRLLTAGR